MAKRANDLLDVFRLGSGENAPVRRKKGSAAKGKRRGRGTPDGLFLAPKQLLLLSSAAILLLVLAFTVGVGVGRKSLGTGDVGIQKNVDREKAVYWILGKLPSHDSLAGRQVDSEALTRELCKELRLSRQYVSVVPADGNLLHVYLGWWPTKAQAEEFMEVRHLDALRLRWGSPFHFAEVVKGQRPR